MGAESYDACARRPRVHLGSPGICVSGAKQHGAEASQRAELSTLIEEVSVIAGFQTIAMRTHSRACTLCPSIHIHTARSHLAIAALLKLCQLRIRTSIILRRNGAAPQHLCPDHDLLLTLLMPHVKAQTGPKLRPL